MDSTKIGEIHKTKYCIILLLNYRFFVLFFKTIEALIEIDEQEEKKAKYLFNQIESGVP